MKPLLLSLTFILSASVFSSEETVHFRCTDNTIQSCKERVAKELDNQNCELLNEQDVTCKKIEGDSQAIYCSASSASCTNASSDGFSGVKCSEGDLVKIKDKKLTSTWAKSIFWIWVKKMCVNL